MKVTSRNTGPAIIAQRKSGHVTLLDVARASGYSASTASIVLNEAPLCRNVTASTQEKIRKIAQQLGYHPDAYARSLQRRRSGSIAVLAYDLSDPFCIPIVRGIQSGLHSVDLLTLLVDAQTKRELFDSYLKMILERRAEGVIVIASWVFEETNLLADIEKNRVPIVILGRDLTSRKISSILVDNEAGGTLAMRHLSELGHRKIAVIRGPEGLFDAEPRWAGVQRAAAEAGIRLDQRLVFELPGLTDPSSSFEGGLDLARRMLASGRPFTAVLAFDDITALGVVRGMNEAGLRVPQDCSVLGFDDVPPAAMATPAITTIRQPLTEMGALAATWTLEAFGAREPGSKQVLQFYKARPELVVRMSTAPPRKNGRSAAGGKNGN